VVVGGGQSHPGKVGIGRAVSLAFAREGAHVVVADQDVSSAGETVALIAAAGGSAETHEVDVTSEASCERLASYVRASRGHVDVLHNNVGGSRVGGAVDADLFSLTEATFQRLLDLNLKGMWLSSKHLAPLMVERGGSIINVSSIASVATAKYDGNAAYRMAKAGVNVLTNLLATWGGPHGVRANALLVGAVDTGRVAARYESMGWSPEERRDHVLADMALKEGLGGAEDVAHAAVFLASDDAAFITGSYLPVDGGETARVP